ncbi:MAG TPA: phage terminase large subunit [Acetobacteraceae bacterium]|jgi:predicted phage terminase large subunit-like protein|nr:phage terminase large subunit [Acetobacteraceae bacterium]
MSPADEELLLSKSLAEDRLMDFVRLMWHAVEPVEPLVVGWAMEAIAEHLEAVSSGQIRHLLMNVPPGFSKTYLCNLFWPAWEWGPKQRPELRYFTLSYTASVTELANEKMRRLVTDPVYQDRWGDVFTANDNKVLFQNNKTGMKLASSIGGTTTGLRGDRVILDDPNNVQAVESEQVRDVANRFVSETMPNRVNNIAKSAFVIIQQRTHENDVSGYLLGRESNWTHLMIPMEFDARRPSRTSIGWRDPRKYDGELAWPERFPRSAVERLKEELGEYAYAGQYQQTPSPRGGGIIKSEWWQVWPPPEAEAAWTRTEIDREGVEKQIAIFPDWEYVLVSLDTAYLEEETADWSACTVWGVFRDFADRPRVMLMEAWRDRVTIHELVLRIIDTARRRKANAVLVEAKASGNSVAQELRRLMRADEWQVIAEVPKGDKTARMHAIVPLLSGGVVFAPERKWSQMVIDEMAQFPRAKYDDLADSASAALSWMRRVGMAKLNAEYEAEVYDDLLFKGNVDAIPYDV